MSDRADCSYHLQYPPYPSYPTQQSQWGCDLEPQEFQHPQASTYNVMNTEAYFNDPNFRLSDYVHSDLSSGSSEEDRHRNPTIPASRKAPNPSKSERRNYKFVPADKKDPEYFKKREKNNDSSKRTRQRKAEMERAKDELIQELKRQVSTLQGQVAFLQESTMLSSAESASSPTSSEGHNSLPREEKSEEKPCGESPPKTAEGSSLKMRARPYNRVPSEDKTKDYIEMRSKNNTACREWRQKRKKMDAQKDERILQLTARVLELEQRIAYLNGKLDRDKK